MVMAIITIHADTYYIKFSEVETGWKTINDDFYNQLEAVEDLPKDRRVCLFLE
jgi:hypothetical protein